jgi:hypothetical protein
MEQESFLSHVISEEGMSVDSRMIQDVLSWNAPTSDADIHSLLGLIGYYRKFMEGFSKITNPMAELLGKDKKFN